MSKRMEKEDEEQAEKEANNTEKEAKPTVSNYLEESTKPKYRVPCPLPIASTFSLDIAGTASAEETGSRQSGLSA